MPDGWSGRELARQARAKGHDVSDAAVALYLNGKHGVPTDPMIEALADTLWISSERLRKVARIKTPGEPWEPPHNSRYLSDEQRDALNYLISTMVERKEGDEGEQRDTPATRTPDSRPDLKAVASGGEETPEEVAAAEAQAAKAKAEQLDAMREMEEKKRRKRRPSK